MTAKFTVISHQTDFNLKSVCESLVLGHRYYMLEMIQATAIRSNAVAHIFLQQTYSDMQLYLTR